MITNAVCHRSYLCPGKVQVTFFDDRLEVTSPGMLGKDLTIEKMKLGISKIRNGAIAKIFFYMNMIEAWGTGIPRILEEAKTYGLREPELQDMGSCFRINLFRRESTVDAYGVIAPKWFEKENHVGTDDTKADVDESGEQKLIFIIRKNGAVTQKQMSEKTGLSLRTVKRLTVELQKNRKIVCIGSSRSGEWKVREE